MTFFDHENMCKVLRQQIIVHCTNPELYLRYGSILASGKIINALCKVAKDNDKSVTDLLGKISDILHSHPVLIRFR